MNIVLLLHSLVRFALLLVMILGLVRAIFSLAKRAEPLPLDQTLAAVFLGLFDLQALVGLLIIFLGGLLGPLHPLLMFIALVIAHWIQSIMRQAQASTASQLRLALYIVPLAIVLFSMALIGHLPL